MGRNAQRRRADRAHGQRPRPLANINGVPVYDGTVVQVIEFGSDDARVLLGIGPPDERPRAYVTLCPCEGVHGLVGELERAGAAAAEHHRPH